MQIIHTGDFGKDGTNKSSSEKTILKENETNDFSEDYKNNQKVNEKSNSEKKKRREGMGVLLMVHGQDMGTGNLLHASPLASKGSLIVVTTNYRLDLFGSFYTLFDV